MASPMSSSRSVRSDSGLDEPAGGISAASAGFPREDLPELFEDRGHQKGKHDLVMADE